MSDRRRMLAAAILTIAALQSGCWSSIEINERAFVTAAALDKAEAPGKLALTLQVINPGKVRQGGPDAILLVSTTANTIFEASRLIRKVLPRKAFWGQIQTIVVGEDLAREGLAQWIDFLDRDFEPNRRVWLLIARGALARTVLQAGFGFSAIPATTLAELVTNAKLTGEAIAANLNDIIMGVEAKSRNVATGFVEMAHETKTPPLQLDPHQMAVLQGSAVFKADKLVGYLNSKESRGVNWVKGTIANTVVVVAGEKPIALEVVEASSKVNSAIENGKPVFTIDVAVEAHVSESRTSNLDLTKPAVTESLGRKLSATIREEIEMAMKQAKKLRTDIFDFGDTLSRKLPREWQKVQNDWNDLVFPTVETRLNVQTVIKHPGFLLKPAQAK